MRLNGLFLVAIGFLVAVRLGWLGGDEATTVPSRLEHAAVRLGEYYRDADIAAGWQFFEVHAEPKAVSVRIHIAAPERRNLIDAPTTLQAASLGNLCPVYNHRVWDLLSGGQHIRIDGVDDSGEVFLSHICPKRGV